MFDECGKKLQKLSKILFVLSIIISIILLFKEGIVSSITIIISSIFSVFILYGFGILVENAEENMKARK